MKSQDMVELQEPPPIQPFWTKIRKAFVVIPVLALVAAIIYGIVVAGEIDTLKAELESVQSVLTSTQSELGSTQSELGLVEETLTLTQAQLNSVEQTLGSTQSELDSTEQILTFVQDELVATEGELNSTKNELASTENQLDSAQLAFTDLQGTLTDTQQRLATAEETLMGLDITLSASNDCSDADLIDNPVAVDPDWSQLMSFLSQDQTEENEYIRDVYDCSEFSRDVHNNAEAAGIRAAVVQIWFEDEDVGHALNAFLTDDYGLVYVDCTGDPETIARIKAEKEYRAVKLHRITKANIREDSWWDRLRSYYYIGSSSRDRWVTESIKIYW